MYQLFCHKYETIQPKTFNNQASPYDVCLMQGACNTQGVIVSNIPDFGRADHVPEPVCQLRSGQFQP